MNQDSCKAADTCFDAVVGASPKVLILGSLPGVRSLEAQQYYAHPANAFWWIMSELFGFALELNYDARIQAICSHHIALWDVIQQGYREGSLDSAIDQRRLQINDFADFVARHSSLQLIAFNGKTAEKLFHREVRAKGLIVHYQGDFLSLPSTSPAYAAMRKADKKARWAEIKAYLG